MIPDSPMLDLVELALESGWYVLGDGVEPKILGLDGSCRMNFDWVKDRFSLSH